MGKKSGWDPLEFDLSQLIKINIWLIKAWTFHVLTIPAGVRINYIDWKYLIVSFSVSCNTWNQFGITIKNWIIDCFCFKLDWLFCTYSTTSRCETPQINTEYKCLLTRFMLWHSTSIQLPPTGHTFKKSKYLINLAVIFPGYSKYFSL